MKNEGELPGRRAFRTKDKRTDLPDASSSFVLYRSTQNNGASWNFPGRYTTVFFDPNGTSGVLEDKALMTVDDNVRSPFRDRIYVTWTEFAADGSAYIYEVHSDDFGETFSDRTVVSKDSADCTNTFGAATPNGNCNENQFSDPFVGPDGALYVAYDNFNNQPTTAPRRPRTGWKRAAAAGCDCHGLAWSDHIGR